MEPFIVFKKISFTLKISLLFNKKSLIINMCNSNCRNN